MLVSASKVRGTNNLPENPKDLVCLLVCLFVLWPQAFLHSPTVKAAEENREMIVEGMLKSLRILILLADGEEVTREESGIGSPQAGDLVTSFTAFEVRGFTVKPIKCGHPEVKTSCSLRFKSGHLSNQVTLSKVGEDHLSQSHYVIGILYLLYYSGLTNLLVLPSFPASVLPGPGGFLSQRPPSSSCLTLQRA